MSDRYEFDQRDHEIPLSNITVHVGEIVVPDLFFWASETGSVHVVDGERTLCGRTVAEGDRESIWIQPYRDVVQRAIHARNLTTASPLYIFRRALACDRCDDVLLSRTDSDIPVYDDGDGSLIDTGFEVGDGALITYVSRQNSHDQTVIGYVYDVEDTDEGVYVYVGERRGNRRVAFTDEAIWTIRQDGRGAQHLGWPSVVRRFPP